MSNLSNKYLNKIGERVRSYSNTEQDLADLMTYRDTYFKSLFELSSLIKKKIEDTTPYLLTGRLKRQKSIIRKLRRTENKNMDLTRIADLAGLRMIVNNRDNQDSIFKFIKKNFEIVKEFDYRNEKQNYRSIHIHARHLDGKIIEIQIRTLAQHTWADESESFGEQVKENSGDPKAIEYLTILSDDINKLERGIPITKNDNFIYQSRNPLEDKLSYLNKNFMSATKQNINNPKDNIYLIVFDSFTRSLNHSDEFQISEVNDVFLEYKRLSMFLDDVRYEHLIMSSNSQNSLKLTHPRFFFKN